MEVLRRFGLRRETGVEITLINTGRHSVYSGMLPGLVAGHYGWRACFIDLEILARFAKAQLLRDIAVGLDLDRRRVRCADAAELPYDVVSVDVGSAPGAPIAAQPDMQVLPVRPVQRFVSTWDGLVHEAGDRDLNLIVVDGSAAAVELCLAMQYRLQQRVPHNRVKFGVVTSSADILPDRNAGVRECLKRVLQARGVSVRAGRQVVGVQNRGLLLDDGEAMPADHVVWAAGPAAPRWLGESGLRTDERGFVLIDDSLRSLSHREVFAVGDIATMVQHPRAESGVYALRQGSPLAANLRAALRGDKPRSFEPRSAALRLTTTGDRNAIASWGPLHAQGAWVWRWKDQIDRRFMHRYAIGQR